MAGISLGTTFVRSYCRTRVYCQLLCIMLMPVPTTSLYVNAYKLTSSLINFSENFYNCDFALTLRPFRERKSCPDNAVS